MSLLEKKDVGPGPAEDEKTLDARMTEIAAARSASPALRHPTRSAIRGARSCCIDN
ncbi:MAG TPA: hypothetical protein VN715_00595 [Roseiarcus sp.]|nr:hypothetical protein [Roseiarcus sp.]